MPRYTVKDDTGRTVTFDWSDPTPPTDADMAEVFASAKSGTPEAPPTEEATPKSVTGFIGNAIKGALRVPVDMVKTAATLDPLVRGMMGGNLEAWKTAGEITRAAPGAIASELKDNYGSLDAIKERAYNDPVGMLMDASTVLPGVGAALKMTKVPGLVKAGTTAASVGRKIDPLTSGVRLAMRVAPTAEKMKAVSENMYTSALKASDMNTRSLSNSASERLAGGSNIADKQRALTKIGLREKAVVGDVGIEKMGQVGDELNAEMAAKVADSQATTYGDERIGGLKQYVQERKDLAAVEPSGQYVSAAEQTRDNFLTDPRVSETVSSRSDFVPDGQWSAGVKTATTPAGGTRLYRAGPTTQLRKELTPTDLLQMKQDLSRTLSADFTATGVSPNAAPKQVLRHDIKTAIEDMVPGVKPLSEREHEVIALREAIENRQKNFGRQNVISMRHGLGSYMFGQQGDTVRNAVAAYFGSKIDDPTYLSRAAIKLEHGIAPKVGAFWSGAQKTARTGSTTNLMRQALLDAMNKTTEQP